jgi:hypothetical protein
MDDFTPSIVKRLGCLPFLYPTLTAYIDKYDRDVYKFEFNYYLPNNPLRYTVHWEVPPTIYKDLRLRTDDMVENCVVFCIRFACFRHGIELSKTVVQPDATLSKGDDYATT